MGTTPRAKHHDIPTLLVPIEAAEASTFTMVFILGINFPETRLLKKSLETFYGIGVQHSSRILAKHSIFPAARVGDLPTKTILAIDAELSSMKIENELRKEMRSNIARLRVMGQRTRSQILTARKLNRTDRVG